MAKISLKTSLKNEEEEMPIIHEGFGLIHEEKIVYHENNVMTTLKRDQKVVSFMRRTDEYELHFSFDLQGQTEGYYKIFAIGSKMHLQINTNMLEWNNHKIEILYRLKIGDVDMGDYLYRLEYEVKE